MEDVISNETGARKMEENYIATPKLLQYQSINFYRFYSKTTITIKLITFANDKVIGSCFVLFKF